MTETTAPRLVNVRTGNSGSLTFDVDFDGRKLQILLTTSQVNEDIEPVLVVWDGQTAPIGRIGLSSRKVGRGWEDVS